MGARYLVPVILLTVFKVIAGRMIFREFSSNLHQVIFPWYSAYALKGYLGRIPAYDSWVYLFCGWDTQYYVALAKNWYFQPLYTFLPAYPVLIRGGSFILNDYWLSASIIAIVFGILSLPVFQRIAEYHLTKIESLYCTLIFGFFPYVFLFTTVAYSESLFIFLTLSSWLLYRRGNLLFSSLACGAASFTKIYGIVAVLPIFADLVYKKDFKKTICLFIPLLSIASWAIYRFLNTGYWLTPPTAESSWAVYGLTFGWIQNGLWPITQTMSGEVLLRTGLILALSLLAASSWSLDWRLGLYSIAMLVLLLYFGTIQSLPRFLSFIYPLWLVPRFRNFIPAAVVLALFSIVDLKFWYQFIMAAIFIG
jgi:hypothetical protein